MTTLQTLAILLLLGLSACNSADKNSAHNATTDTTGKSQSDKTHLPMTGNLYKKTPQQIERNESKT